MKKEIKLNLSRIKYTLVFLPEATYTPWVAAFRYDKTDNTWGQGHYFTNKYDALEYLVETYKERTR